MKHSNIDEWMDDYFDSRPQLKRPEKDYWGKYDMPDNIRHAFEKMFSEYWTLDYVFNISIKENSESNK